MSDSSSDSGGSSFDSGGSSGDTGSSVDIGGAGDHQDSGGQTAGDPNAMPPFGGDSTVGTGSVLGVGCSIVAVVFILIAVCIFMFRQIS